jgi:DNA (cytosine-5)-methyltransferase 1
VKIGSLFAGIGGFDLAGEWCGHRTIWTSEIDPFCVELLAERFPAAKQLGDISTIDWSQVERPDILTGGFPCQDISYAGKGAGLAGKRSGLWYEYARAIRELGPRYVIVENVRALFTRGFDAVLGTLADLGYDAEWSMYGAADVGAPHRRQRVWILA